MTTPAQGKGKKKNKADKKVPLDEFNQIDAPRGHSVVNLKVTGLDWAETMADYDQQTAAETQQIIVPTAPRAQRGPAVDVESLPHDPPFRVSLYNLPMSFEEKEIADRIFQGLEIIRVETQAKSSTTVEFANRQDLVEALCKDGTNFKGRTINVCLYGQAPPNNHQDRYGGRGSSSFDRYSDRTSNVYGGSRSSDRYGDRQGGGFGRDREGGGFGSFNRSGGFGQRGGYNDRYPDRGSFGDNRGSFGASGQSPAEEPSNWRSAARPTVKPPPPTPSYNNGGGSRQLYTSSRSEPSSYQQPAPSQYSANQESYHPSRQQHYNQPRNHSPHTPYNNQVSSDHRMPASTTFEERPKLKLTRNKPLNLDATPSSRNEAIFGKAQPSSKPYEKMHEIEEKLSAVQLSDRKASPQGPSQPGSQPGSAPRSRRVSERE